MLDLSVQTGVALNARYIKTDYSLHDAPSPRDNSRPTGTQADRVAAPLMDGCYANFECRLIDDRQIDEGELLI
ncbi:flavin reductase family protein [Stutzerimonas stutzeri]|uniref:flavin reductase family protein n=1 Tax=Stutzerimonas stutzeri TaxID=316 RepID=UPI00210C9D9D|nr:flavin reductase family protein [Stutzerimonas stutzeri]MCQ4258150.1 flavin reductase family protein [Stutzerimonas stutzeri]